jgi:hypothetical protein
MKALDKLVPDEEECDKIQQQLSQYMLVQGAFGTLKRSREFEFSCVVERLWWWHPTTPMFGNTGAFIVVNTSSAESCWSTYSFIHNVKRKRLNAGRAESLVYVHYNLQVLSHY